MFRRGGPDLDANRAETEAWAASIPEHPTDDEVVALAAGFAPRMAVQLRALLEAGFGAGIPAALVERLATRAERRRARVAGEGDVRDRGDRDGRSGDRHVAAGPDWSGRAERSPRCSTRASTGCCERLRAARQRPEPDDLVDFLDRFDVLLAEHGHRGPNEVELASSTWGTSPALVLAVVERLRLSPDSADPEAAAPRLATERAEAGERLRRAVAPPLRPVIARMLAAVARGTARREQAKGTIVLGISALRRPLFLVADRLVRGRPAPGPQRSCSWRPSTSCRRSSPIPPSLAAVLAERRAAYDDLNSRTPPFAFEGGAARPDDVAPPDRPSGRGRRRAR